MQRSSTAARAAGILMGLSISRPRGITGSGLWNTGRNVLDLIYDKQSDQAFNPGIDDVDNLTVSAGGDVLVAEDGSEMRLVVVGPNVKPFELVNVIGQRESEICGPAFSPDGGRLYFSSQNGPAGDHTDGRIYELRGPFFIDA